MHLRPGAPGWVAHAGDEVWTLQKVGFHRPRVVIRPLDQLAEVAHLEPDWRGLHHLRFVSGPTWELDPTHSGGVAARDAQGAFAMSVSWAGLDDSRARVVASKAALDGRFGALCLAAAGLLLLDRSGPRARRIAVGVPLGATVRTRFHD